MDFPSKEELIANKMEENIQKIAEYLEVDSLEYMTTNELLEAMIDHDPNDFCTACFSGKYPIELDKKYSKEEYD
jgi:amidophosphoribosyltransferase